MLTIYHNPRCKKSREGLAYLTDNNIAHSVVDYLKQGLTEANMKEILLKLHLSPSEIVRTQEEVYKKELKGRQFNDDEWIQIIIENPKLLQRPIVLGKTKGVLAQPPSRIEELL